MIFDFYLFCSFVHYCYHMHNLFLNLNQTLTIFKSINVKTSVDTFSQRGLLKTSLEDFTTNETVIKHLDKTWNLDPLELIDHGQEKN